MLPKYHVDYTIQVKTKKFDFSLPSMITDHNSHGNFCNMSFDLRESPDKALGLAHRPRGFAGLQRDVVISSEAAACRSTRCRPNQSADPCRPQDQIRFAWNLGTVQSSAGYELRSPA